MGIRYLNHAAVIRCVHGGAVQLMPPPSRAMHVEGSPILTDRDLLTAMIVGCPQIGPGLKPCTKIVTIMLGLSQQIQVDGQTPILQTLKAMTDGVAPGIVNALTDGQSNAETLFGMAGSAADNSDDLALEAAKTAADLAGIVDPTPVSDSVSAGISLKQGDWIGAALSGLSMIPYLGDLLAKPYKLARNARRLAKLRSASARVERFGNMKTAAKYYKEAGFSRARRKDHMQGINFDKPVTVETLPRNTKLEQWQKPGNPKGNYFAKPGTDPRTIGVPDPGARQARPYTVQRDTPVLKSTAGDIKMKTPQGPVEAKGGGTQYFTSRPGDFE